VILSIKKNVGNCICNKHITIGASFFNNNNFLEAPIGIVNLQINIASLKIDSSTPSNSDFLS
jgi:hypothetical protein